MAGAWDMAFLLAAVLLFATALATTSDDQFGRLAWQHGFTDNVEARPAVGLVNGKEEVFVGTYGDGVFALSSDNGKQLIKPFYSNNIIRSSPAIYTDPATGISTLFVLSDDGLFYAVDCSTLAKKWSFNSGAPAGSLASSSPALYEAGQKTLVYFGSIDGNIYALNLSGDKVWSFQTDDAVFASPAVVLVNNSHPLVVVGSDDTYVYGLDGLTGEQLWIFSTDDRVRGSAAFLPMNATKDNGNRTIVYIGSNDGNLYAIDAISGSALFNVSTKGPVYSTPVVHVKDQSSATVYFGSYDDNVYAIDALTSAVQWKFTTRDNVIASPIIITNSTSVSLYVGGEDQMFYAIDGLTGKKLWQYVVQAPIWCTAAVVSSVHGPLVVFGSQGQGVFALKTVL